MGHHALAEGERRHQLRARLAEQLRDGDDLESRRAQAVDNLRQGLHGVAAIAAAVMQQHDVAAVRARLLEHALHDHVTRARAERRPARPNRADRCARRR